MLAHFSLLGVFFSLLVGSWALLEHFLLILIVFFRVLGRSELDFGWSGTGFGAFKTTFLAACWCQQAHVTEILFMQENHNFCDVL